MELLAVVGWLALAIPVVMVVIRFVQNVRAGYDEADREDRRRRGRCLACGYSLRRNVSGVRPECGTRVTR